VLITSDQNLKYQQNLSGRKLAVVVLPSNHLPTVLAMAPAIASALATIKQGDYIELPLP
jgi:hypothetical protein